MSDDQVLKGNSSEFIDVIDKIKQFAKINAPILIQGESGSGKDAMAYYLYHLRGETGRFEKFNSSQLSLQEFKDLIFGNKEKTGLFEDEFITLYLDNIEELDLENQARVLRVLEYSEIDKNGHPVKARAKLIASTKKNIADLLLSEELFYRISLLSLRLPPLRERKGDIPLLVAFFLKIFNDRYEKKCIPGDEILSFFNQYSFPGNVRELKNIIESMVITNQNKKELGLDDLPEWIWEIARKQQSNDFVLMPISEYERRVILKTLKAVGNNRTRAANILGISERNLYRKIKGLESEKVKD